jgi:hypothetical protein
LNPANAGKTVDGIIREASTIAPLSAASHLWLRSQRCNDFAYTENERWQKNENKEKQIATFQRKI